MSEQLLQSYEPIQPTPQSQEEIDIWNEVYQETAAQTLQEELVQNEEKYASSIVSEATPAVETNEVQAKKSKIKKLGHFIGTTMNFIKVTEVDESADSTQEVDTETITTEESSLTTYEDAMKNDTNRFYNSSYWDVEPVSKHGLTGSGEVERYSHELDQELVAAFGEELSSEDIISRLEANRVVRNAPRIEDIMYDDERTNPIRHINSTLSTQGSEISPENEVTTQSERVSVYELAEFLRSYIRNYPEGDPRHHLAEIAADMHDNITYIGEKERQEAIVGISEYWKSTLRENPKLQICALAAYGEEHSERVKSGQFLLDGVLGQFSDEELEEFKDRLILDPETITSLPEDTRIILLDDWTISGQQMRDGYQAVIGRLDNPGYKQSIEVQLVTATQERIENGIKLNYYSEDGNIPVRSYFMSHTAREQTAFSSNGHNAYETGSHSSVDYDFETTYIQGMVNAVNSVIASESQALYQGQDPFALHPEPKNPETSSNNEWWETPEAEKQKTKKRMPLTTNIARSYRKDPLANVGRLRSSRKDGSVQMNRMNEVEL